MQIIRHVLVTLKPQVNEVTPLGIKNRVSTHILKLTNESTSLSCGLVCLKIIISCF